MKLSFVIVFIVVASICAGQPKKTNSHTFVGGGNGKAAEMGIDQNGNLIIKDTLKQSFLPFNDTTAIYLYDAFEAAKNALFQRNDISAAEAAKRSLWFSLQEQKIQIQYNIWHPIQKPDSTVKPNK